MRGEITVIKLGVSPGLLLLPELLVLLGLLELLVGSCLLDLLVWHSKRTDRQ